MKKKSEKKILKTGLIPYQIIILFFFEKLIATFNLFWKNKSFDGNFGQKIHIQNSFEFFEEFKFLSKTYII